MQDPLSFWKADFGRDYIQRNPPSAEHIEAATEVFRRILTTSGIMGNVSSVLEVGANIGINLQGLREVLGAEASLAALEPNHTACQQLKSAQALRLDRVIEGAAYSIPCSENSFDLVFTNGVLIHIPPEQLDMALAEIVRVSKRYILCSEYFSHEPAAIEYRGRNGLLWKRDFGRAYLEAAPYLSVVSYGFLWQREFWDFDDLNWFLFEKPPLTNQSRPNPEPK